MRDPKITSSCSVIFGETASPPSAIFKHLLLMIFNKESTYVKVKIHTNILQCVFLLEFISDMN